LEPDIQKILQEEKSEKELAKVENEANRIEKLLKVEDSKEQRSWFQSKKERKKEKGNSLTYFNIIFILIKKKIAICHYEILKFLFSDNHRLTKKQIGKSKKQEKEPFNIVQEKKKKAQNEPKQDTAEDRAKKELEKIVAYQARLAKKSNKQKKIRTIMDENNRDFTKKSTISYL